MPGRSASSAEPPRAPTRGDRGGPASTKRSVEGAPAPGARRGAKPTGPESEAEGTRVEGPERSDGGVALSELANEPAQGGCPPLKAEGPAWGGAAERAERAGGGA